jgi:hypothetical protein
VFPPLRQIVQRKNCGHRADGYAGATIDALHGIDVELRGFVEARTAMRCLAGVFCLPRVFLGNFLQTT